MGALRHDDDRQRRADLRIASRQQRESLDAQVRVRIGRVEILASRQRKPPALICRGSLGEARGARSQPLAVQQAHRRQNVLAPTEHPEERIRLRVVAQLKPLGYRLGAAIVLEGRVQQITVFNPLTLCVTLLCVTRSGHVGRVTFASYLWRSLCAHPLDRRELVLHPFDL